MSIKSHPLHLQAAVFFLAFVLLIACTLIVIGPLFSFLRTALPNGFFEKWTGTFWVIGLFYAGTGILHFANPDLFISSKISRLRTFSLHCNAVREQYILPTEHGDFGTCQEPLSFMLRGPGLLR